MRTTFIYILWDPRNNGKCYIGKANNPQKRYHKGHRHERGNYYKVNWLQKLYSLGVEPTLEVIDEINEDGWQFWERYYISLYRSWGFRLVNATDGGEGFSTTWNKGLTRKTSEKVDRIAKLKEGKKLLDSTKKKKSEALKGRKHTEEHRAKQLNKLVQRHSQTTKEEKSLVARKVWETRRKNGTHIQTEEQKKAKSARMRGRKLSEETKLKIKIARNNRNEKKD